MGAWTWFKDKVDAFFHDPSKNVNAGLIANPFLVKEAPDANHYHVGAVFGDDAGTEQNTRIELWAAADTGRVHVGFDELEDGQPSFTLAAITNGMLRLVPEGASVVIPRTDRHEATKVTVQGPAYILEGVDTAVDSYHTSLNADIWIEGGLAPPNRPVPAVLVYENVDISVDLDELIQTWFEREKKPPFWTDAKREALVQSWKAGESTAYVEAGYPIGRPRATAPADVVRPVGANATARFVGISVYDEFGLPIDLGWLLRHADLHSENTIFDSLVAPGVDVFRKDPVRDKLPRRDIIDLRDEHGLPYAGRAFRRFTEANFPPLTSVFDTDVADLVLQTQPETTGAAGLWIGPVVPAATEVVIQGIGLLGHLLSFLPSCPSSTVVLKLRGYPGDYHRIIAFPLEKWFPEQPSAKPDQAPKRFHLGCRVTPLVDGQVAHAVMGNAIRATFERSDSDPANALELRPVAQREASMIWLCNWTIGPELYPYGGSEALFLAADPATNAEFTEGLAAYPEHSLGFYLQSAIAARIDVRLLPWLNILATTERGKNIEIVKAVNRYYDINAYHPQSGIGTEAQRHSVDVTGVDPIPPNLSRGFAAGDDKTRGFGSHHQKISFIRNRYGDFAFLGGVDLQAGRWDTTEHRTDEPRGEGSGWHDVHIMLEGPVVQDAAKNFFQRWNAFMADAPAPGSDYPIDLAGVTPIESLPQVAEEGVPDWAGPANAIDPDAPIDPHVLLDRGPDGRRQTRPTHVCAVVRTIPPYIDAYEGFVKARPVPNDGAPLGELGCLASYTRAIENARHFIYLEDQYFIEPVLTQLLIERLTDPDPKKRLPRLFVVVPHILADQSINDAIYHHFRTKHTLLIRQAVRARLAQDRGVPAETIPDEDVDSVFTIAHLRHPSGSEIYLHAKHMVVDDLWMVISSSNFSRRGMTYETEIGATVTDARVEDGIRKVVRDHRIQVWAEHLKLPRAQWHRLLDPIAGATLLLEGLSNPNIPLIPFEIENDEIPFRYDPENHSAQHELVYTFISDPDGREAPDLVAAETARAAVESLES